MCGIVAFFPKTNQKVDLNKLIMLALGNEERGKDNAGIAIGNIYYDKSDGGIDAKNFLVGRLTEIRKLDLTNQNVIFHTRSASNKLNLKKDSAHPFKWITEGSDYHFVGCHNGKVENTHDILEKHIKTNTFNTLAKHIDYNVDSEYILHALQICGTDYDDILSSYRGNAALAFYDNKHFNIWKGANNNVEERPLYYSESEEGWYISSIGVLLELINGEGNVVKVQNNELITFANNSFTSRIIPRNVAPVVYHSYTGYHSQPVKQHQASTYWTSSLLGDDYEDPKTFNNKQTSLVSPEMFEPVIDLNFKYIHPTTRKELNGVYYAIKDREFIGTHYLSKTGTNTDEELYFSKGVCFIMKPDKKDYEVIAKLNKGKDVTAQELKTLGLIVDGFLPIYKRGILSKILCYSKYKNLTVLIENDNQSESVETICGTIRITKLKDFFIKNIIQAY